MIVSKAAFFFVWVRQEFPGNWGGRGEVNVEVHGGERLLDSWGALAIMLSVALVFVSLACLHAKM